MEGKTLKGRRMRRTSETAGTQDLPLTLLFVPGSTSGPVLSILTCPWVEEQGCPNFSSGSPTCWGAPQPWTKEAGWSHYLQVKVTQPLLTLVESHGPKNSHLKLEEGHRALDEELCSHCHYSCNRTEPRWPRGDALSVGNNLEPRICSPVKSMRELLELGRSLQTTVPGSSV